MRMEEKLSSRIIPIVRPWFSEEEEEILAETLRSGWVAQGPRVRSFEEALARYVGAPYAVATNSCTSALQVTLEILGVGPGDEVILPSFTFIATANAVVHRGARPVFVDIDPRTYNLHPGAVEASVTPRTKAVIAVDQGGLPANLAPLHLIANRKHLSVLEDAACALGSVYHGKKVGATSDLSCFSFHPRKLITTGEGGMITATRQEYAQAARTLVSHGASVSDLARHQSSKVLFEEYRVAGYNYRMSDLQAAVGLAQMKKLDEILVRKRFLAERYHKAFESMDELVPPFEPEGIKGNFQSYLLRIRSSTKKGRDAIMEELLRKGISTRRGIMAIHLEPAYRDRFGPFSLPETERAFRETLILPLYPQMTVEEQAYVIESLKETLVS